MVSGGLIPMEMFEEQPGFCRMLDGLRSLGRVIVFDRRGLGMSDPITSWERPITEQWTDDLATVIEAAGVEKVALVTWDGFGVGSRYTATHAEQVSALVLIEPMIVADDDWQSWSDLVKQRSQANMRGESDILTLVAPSLIADRTFRDWYQRAGRVGASPATASRIWESAMRPSPRDALLERVIAPTLVLHRRDNHFVPDDVLARAGERLPHATLVELDGCDHFPFVGDVGRDRRRGRGVRRR